MIGRTLNHYEIVGQLGKGGMGEVYVAQDSKLGRKVAVKILPAEVAGDNERRARFEREAKAVAALNHPNIVTVYSVEHDGDVHFMTMELVEGTTLTEILHGRNGLPLKRLLDVAVDLTDALTGAHRKGITHRDLKPDNVMIGSDGRLKVLDFGLAKVAGDSTVPDGGTALPTQTVTQEGKIIGTVAYMAPEQAEGKTADARSDVFSLGVILYEMATGIRPFTGDSSISTITSILRDQPQSITQVNRSLPRHLARIVKRCLEKDPDRRYQTAHDLRNDLLGLRDELESGDLHASEVSVAGPTHGSRPRWPMIAAAVVVVAAVAFGVMQWSGRRARPLPAAPASAARNMEITRLTATGHCREATVSPDGRYVVYILEEAGDLGLWVTQVSTGSKVEILPAAHVGLWDPTFSPDGDFVYFIRFEEPGPPDLYRVPTLGGNARKIMDHVNGRVSFSPDGQRFVFLRGDPATGETRLVVSGTDGSGPRVIATAEAPSEFDDPVWSPDGKVIAASLQTFTEGIRDTVGSVPVDGGDWAPLTERAWIDVGEIAWLPDGSGLVINAGGVMTTQLWEVSYPGGRVLRVTNDLNSYHGVSLTADGRTLATVLEESSFNLWVLSPGPDAEPVRLTSGTRTNDGLGIDWTPDGRIVYGSDSGGKPDVWIVDSDGSDASRLTTEALNVGPRVTPDGRRVVFMSNRADTVNLWRTDLDGGNPLQLTHGSLEVAPSVSPDGRWVVYLEPGSGKLFRVSIDGGEPIEIRDKRSGEPSVSPDGKSILTGSFYEEAGRWQVDVIPFEGGDPVATFYEEDTNLYDWAPDGSLSYTKLEGGVQNVWKRALDGGEPVQITHFDADLIQDYAWSRDGKHLVVSRGRTDTDVVLLENFR